MRDLTRLCVHTMTTKPWGLETACRKYAAAGIPAITVWRQAIAPLGLRAAAAAVRSSGLEVTSLCRGGFFPALDASARQRAIDDNRTAIDEAAALGAPSMVLVCGAVPGLSQAECRKHIAEGIAAVLPHARACGVRLSIEPLHPQYAADRSAVTTMAQARRLCQQLNDPGRHDVGIAADVYHIWWDDQVEVEIAEAGRLGILHAFHVCDWKVHQEDTLNDRGLMGEGVIDIPHLRRCVDAAGFTGDIEVEIFSTRWWATDQDDFLQRIINAYRTAV